mgnify:CR=1 FL=1
MSTEATTTEPVTQEPSPATTTSLVSTEPKATEPSAEPGKTEPAKAEPEFKPIDASALKFPEGFEKNDAVLGQFLEITNGAKLPVETVQKLADLQANLVKEASEAGSKLWTETQAKWQDEVRADAEIGGQKLEENLSHVAKLIDRVSGDQAPAVREAFAMTGAGNHPALVKFMVKVAKELSEPAPVAGAPGNVSRDTASLLYPNQGQK